MNCSRNNKHSIYYIYTITHTTLYTFNINIQKIKGKGKLGYKGLKKEPKKK